MKIKSLWQKLNEHKGTHLEASGAATNCSRGDSFFYDEVPNDSILQRAGKIAGGILIAAGYLYAVYYVADKCGVWKHLGLK